ncbi:MAG: hypothetical protein ACYDDB_03190 [bacterium]
MVELGFNDSCASECANPEKIFYPLSYPIISLAVEDPQNYTKNGEIEQLLHNIIYLGTPDKILLFREDNFDPITRIRRGRFYKKSDRGNPRDCRVPEHIGGNPSYTRSLIIYMPYYNIGKNHLIAIGSGDSVWRAISIDRISTGEFLVTLKSRNTFGVIPEIDEERIPKIRKQEIISELDHFIDVANRETPGSIVDAARNVAISLIRSYIFANRNDEIILTKDLGELIKELKQHEKFISKSAANIINLFHSRNKPNQKTLHGSRSVTEEDSEVTVSLIGLLLQEFGWAK